MFSLFNKKRSDKGLVAIGKLSNGIGLSRINTTGGESPVLEILEYAPAEGMEECQQALKQMVSRHKLEGSRCSLLMERENYSILLTDAPDVPQEELADAMRWRVKDLVDFDIEDAVIDVFEVPGHKVVSGKQMVYVVVAQASVVSERVDLVLQSGLELTTIDIPEMALRNLTALAPEDVSGTALISLGKETGLICLTRQSVLHLARRFSIATTSGAAAFYGAQQDSNQQLLDQLVIEVQRSIDYFERHFTLPPVKELLIMPLNDPLPELEETLSSQLGLNVRTLEIKTLINAQADIDEAVFNRCASLVGAALRQEAVS